MNETHSEADLQGKRYWRSLNEYANSPALREKIVQEFPDYDPDELLGMSRRKFMKLAGASMALAGLTLTGCRRWPKEHVVPHNARPEGTLPGVPETYASMLMRGGVAHGLFVTSFDGRPIFVGGNPLHPICGDAERYDAGDLKFGATDAFSAASILEMYDPDRSRAVMHMRKVDGHVTAEKSDWALFQQAIDLDGKKVAVLSEPQSGPAFADVKARFLKKYPNATWTTWEPLHRDSEIEGTLAAFEQPLRAQYDTSKAMVLAMFDSDLLTEHPAAAKHARGWAAMRRSCDEGTMSRVYAIGPTLTPCSSNADEHMQVLPSVVAAMLDVLAARLGVAGASKSVDITAEQNALVEQLAADLKAHPGASIVSVGPGQPVGVHALAWAINDKLGNLGKTITLTQEPAGEDTLAVSGLRDLVEKINAGDVDTLLILGGNPVYDAPVDLGFSKALAKVKTSVHLGLYENETSVACDWHLPEAHYLECWGDGRAWDGTVCLQQPLILPLFAGKSAMEVLAMLAHDEATEGYDLVRRAWSGALKAGQYDLNLHGWSGGPAGTADMTAEKKWRAAVHDGLIRGSAWPAVSAKVANAGPTGVNVSPSDDSFQVVFRQDSKVYDGRHANNGWLQEVPEIMTKVTWDNPAWISVGTAKKLGLHNGDVVKLDVDGRSLEVAVFIMPGQAERCIVLTLGQGRSVAGRIGTDVGFNAYALRGTNTQGVANHVKLTKTGQTHAIATTEDHHLINPDQLDTQGTDEVAAWGLAKRIGGPGENAMLIKQVSLEDYKHDPHFATAGAHGDVSLQLYDGPLTPVFVARAEELKEQHPEEAAAGWNPPTAFNDKHAWGMTIDMTACMGCNACVIACQSENNIPIVGKDQVMMSREMHWLRMDSYYRGNPEATSSKELDVVHMPVTCVHCENAPCEQVCPVAATVHDTEGLNTMVYNRCIGTRYCSNNCPYKVRRFNYFDFHSKLDTDMFRTNRKPGGISNKPWLKFPDQQQGDVIDQIRRMVFNPDVTVRMRGVMEKCTYCTQRIARAKIEAKARWAEAKTAGKDVVDYPAVADGDVFTACQAACPTEAITFGNLNDPKSKVSKQQKNPRSYKLLEELNSRPRTRHMGLVRNPAT